MKKTAIVLCTLCFAFHVWGQSKTWMSPTDTKDIRKMVFEGDSVLRIVSSEGFGKFTPKYSSFKVGQINSTWVQCADLQNFSFTGFGASGNRLIAGVPPWGATSEDYLALSTDDGTSWTVVDTIPVNNHSPGFHFWINTTVRIFAYGGNIFAGIGGGLSGSLYLSTDSGMSWTEPDSGFLENINGFAAIGGTIFVGTDDGVFLSTDNGTSWSPANTGMTHQVMGLAVIGTSLFAGTPLAGVFLSTNNGASWSAVDTGLTNVHIYDLAAIGSTIFAGAFQFPGDSTGGVFVSTNNGANWNVADTGLTTHTINALIANGTNLYVGTNSGVYTSSDYGTRWIDISSGTPFGSIGALSLAVSDSFLLAGTSENGVWRYPLSQLKTDVKNGQGQIPSDFALKQNYPNPFNPKTVISYELPVSRFVNLEVYDVLGREIRMLVSERQSAGTHSVTFNAGGLSSGVYFYRLTAGSYGDTKKLILAK
jgi:hypothetical protein